jgi:hypothetical protein
MGFANKTDPYTSTTAGVTAYGAMSRYGDRRHKQFASPDRMGKAGQITIIGLAGGR